MVLLLLEVGQFDAAFDRGAEFGEALDQQGLTLVLRQHEDVRVRSGQGAEIERGDEVSLAEDVEPAHRQAARDCPLGDAEAIPQF